MYRILVNKFLTILKLKIFTSDTCGSQTAINGKFLVWVQDKRQWVQPFLVLTLERPELATGDLFITEPLRFEN